MSEAVQHAASDIPNDPCDLELPGGSWARALRAEHKSPNTVRIYTDSLRRFPFLVRG
jgi:hypothetical protein